MSQPGVAVRPAGCTQADQVLVHSNWSGSALAQSGDPGVSALWASLLQGLEHMCHVQVLQAVEALEAGQYILEETFPWFAAELAVEAGDDVPWPVAASAIRDVIANLNSNADGKKLLLVSSNVTKWRKSLATFLAGIRPDLWLVQETHIKEEQGDLLATHVGAFGYQAFSLPGHPTGGGGNSGGLAIVFKKHLDVRKSHHFLHQGVGFQSVVLRIRGVDIFLVNVYLKTGEGFRGPTNAIILSNLIPFLRSLQGEFLVAGDFNEDISVLVTTSLAQEARGQWVHTGASTCTGGGNIDFGLVSKGLALGVSVRADWITPFAPHAALHWCIDRRQCELRFPQLVGFKPMPIMPQPFEPPLAGCSGPQPDLESACAGHWGGSIPEPALTHTFEQLSSSVELSVYGCTQGRGCLPKFRRDKLLRHTSPVGAWGGAQASFWKRVLVWLELSVKRSCPAPFGHTFWSQLELMWHGSTAELSVFQVQLDAVLKGVTPSAFPELIQVSEQQFRHHSKLWMQKQSASYGKWLKQASCKGLRGLFTSVKADEAVQLRPFLHQPVQERIYLRWRQWFELWSAPGGVDPALLSDLRQRARMQAKELGPIPLDQAVAAFKRVPSKAPGLDGWTFEMLKNLQRPAVASIISFLHHCETEATWPAQMVFALIALLPKSEKRERPIALLHVLYRTWVRMRWKLVSDWQFQYCKAAVWDKAMPGSQVLDVALGRLLRGEAARQSGQHLVTIFIDMETFYDRCRFNDVISSGLSLGYPPLVLHQALLTYMGPRFLQSEGSLCPAITPTKGVLAGCPAAPSISKLVVHPIAVAATSKRATSNLDVWIDDLSLDCVGASAKQIASDAVLLFRSLRTSIEATGARDHRAACVAWAIAAYELAPDGPKRAAFELFGRVSGAFDLTVDCIPEWRRLLNEDVVEADTSRSIEESFEAKESIPAEVVQQGHLQTDPFVVSVSFSGCFEGADVASLEACILVLSNRRQQTHKDWCKSVRPPRQSKERKPGKAALALHTVWEKLTPEARLAIEEAGWRPPSAAAVVPPPGLGDFDVDMDASEACEAKQKLWSEATEQQKELMLKAGLKPPEQTPAPTSYEVGTAANAAFRKATVALKLLGDKKISLQKRIDQAKEQYNARLTEMKQLQTKIEEAQQQVADAGEELTTKVLAQDESLNGEIAQFLEKFGISLTEEQEAKIAAVRAGTHGPADSQAFDLKAAAPNTQEVPKKSEPAQNGVAVRPAGCTQADQVLVHSTWSGSALAQSGDPGVSALWASLLQGLEHMCHVQVLQAVEALEAGQYILEDTFPWFAAELAVEAGDDVPWHVAASAIRDVIANLESNADGKKLLLVSSNVTKWRKSLATFLAGIRPDLWLVQETHIKEEQGDLLATHVGAFGYQAFSLPGHPTGGGGNSGGLAIVFKKHLDVRKSHHFLHQGVGFQSVVLRIRGVDIFLVNVYLKTGEGFRGPTNAIILSNLIPFLRSLQGEFLVAGDFNEDISVLVTTSLAQEARGQWVHTGASTCTGGGNIDFGLVSKGLALGVSVRADWITPFAPHAALHWCIDRRQCELRFPQLVGFKPMPIMPQPFEPPLAGCSGPQPDLESACAGHWGGSIPEPALTHTFEQLSSSVELSVYGCTQGRGCLPKFRRDKLLRHTSPVGAWGGAQASFWKRVLVWLELSVKRSCPAPFGHTFWSQLELMWHGSTAELSVFQVQLDAVLKGVTPSAFPELIQVSEQQFRHHSKLWMQKQSASYGKWLKQASCKGLRGLFTSVKADEAVQLRPFLHQPVQERIYLRWRQWFELWSAPGGVDPALLSDLRQRARMQAKELGPIPLDQAVAAFKRVPSKAPGLDGWTFEMLNNLQRPAVASIISFLHHCETEATWPAQMVFALIALLPKSEKRERPIALLHVLYRTWVRMRWKLVSDWQFQYCKAAVWDKAMPGSQVLDVALGRLLRGEAARQSGQHLVTIFIDMETFYDRCRFNDVISSGLSLGYPPLVLHQALLTYMGPRFLQSEGSLCPAITPTKGVLAGCPAAPSISKLVVHPIAVAATSKRATSNLDVWIDDLSLDCVGASAKQIASDAVLLFRSLRTSIEANGAKLSLDKTSFVASSSKAAKCLQAVRVDT
ncbi:unnamed protein product, partial [Symbiodinium sp. CCMP2592]